MGIRIIHDVTFLNSSERTCASINETELCRSEQAARDVVMLRCGSHQLLSLRVSAAIDSVSEGSRLGFGEKRTAVSLWTKPEELPPGVFSAQDPPEPPIAPPRNRCSTCRLPAMAHSWRCALRRWPKCRAGRTQKIPPVLQHELPEGRWSGSCCSHLRLLIRSPLESAARRRWCHRQPDR